MLTENHFYIIVTIMIKALPLPREEKGRGMILFFLAQTRQISCLSALSVSGERASSDRYQQYGQSSARQHGHTHQWTR